MSPGSVTGVVRGWLGRAPVVGLLMVLLVVAGISLQEVWPPAVLLIAAGAFLPGLLREMGLGRGDEFQMQVSRRSGQWACLLGGSTLVLMLLLRPWERIPDPGPAAVFALRITLLVMILTYLLVSLVGYWGVRRAVSRLLLVFGSFWLLFVVLSHPTEPMALVTLVLPVFVAGLLLLTGPPEEPEDPETMTSEQV
jgi:hypothetical protein